MVLRLLLALVIALSTAPAAVAMPACHGAMPEMAGMSHHAPKPDKAMSHESLCLGCIAPVTVHPPVVTALPRAPGLPPLARALAGLALASLPPSTPPPRNG